MKPDQKSWRVHAPAWMVLAASTIGMGAGFGVTSSFSVFMAPLEQAFGWSHGELSFAYTLMTIGMAGGGLLWAAWPIPGIFAPCSSSVPWCWQAG